MTAAKSKTIEPGKVTKAPKLGKKEFKLMAQQIVDDLRGRQQRRKDLELQWSDIDRQLAMIPDCGLKTLPNGQADTKKAWMAEMELPLQADALEILTADTQRMMFPTTGHAFEAKAYLDDAFLEKNAAATIVFGDSDEVPSAIDQSDSNKLIRAFIENNHNQYDFTGTMKMINSEAIKYSMGNGRWRMAEKNIYLHTAKGVVKETRNIPILVPKSIKNTYPDDQVHKTQNEGLMIGGSVIDRFSMRIQDLTLAAKTGSDDPNNPLGGWRSQGLKGIEADDNGMVETMMFEGDLLVSAGTNKSLFLPGALITVVVGNENSGTDVVRFRWRKIPNNSNVFFPYQQDKIDSPYGTSPLMKGRPIQIAATDALNRMMDAAALLNDPPLGYDEDNPGFAATLGPQSFPGATWQGGADGVKAHMIGNPAVMSGIYAGLLQQYATTTGATPARFGATTKSHTTAFAKQAELTQGATRTFDYAESSANSPMAQMLYIEYNMARTEMTGNASFFVDDFGGAVTITKDQLPEKVDFEWFGAAGPAEEQSKQQSKLQSAELAIGLDNIKVQRGEQPSMDLDAMQREVLREGGWTDIDQILNISPENSPGVAGRAEGPGAGAPSAPALLQSIVG